ncbi:hypothetical protein F0562_009523 [Nyssa sinensis]|uniref:Uncharacterized protein n=1 Tax=Nyssa sinensis TaxID=561372 RepID=A0A5J4ZXS1_9ASTE|nr:hypothetical protein F0562_009523 [Nyssa sinensis]
MTTTATDLLYSRVSNTSSLKVDDLEKNRDRDQANGGSTNVYSVSSIFSNPKVLPNEDVTSVHRGKEKFLNSNRKVDQGDKGFPLLIENDDDILGPETPGVRPLVPRLKRNQEDSCHFEGKIDCSLLDSSKRMKLLQDSKLGNKNHEDGI